MYPIFHDSLDDDGPYSELPESYNVRIINIIFRKLMKKNAWKLYTAFMCVFLVWLSLPFELTFKNAIATCLAIVSLAGLYGYAFEVRIGRVGFWKIFSGLTVFSWLVVMTYLSYSLLLDAETKFMGSTRIVFGILVVQIPLLYALMVYSRKSTAIWQQSMPQHQVD